LHIGKILVYSGFVNEEDYIKAYSKVLDIPYIDFTNYLVDLETIHFIPESLARKFKVAPISKIGDTLLKTA